MPVVLSSAVLWVMRIRFIQISLKKKNGAAWDGQWGLGLQRAHNRRANDICWKAIRHGWEIIKTRDKQHQSLKSQSYKGQTMEIIICLSKIQDFQTTVQSTQMTSVKPTWVNTRRMSRMFLTQTFGDICRIHLTEERKHEFKAFLLAAYLAALWFGWHKQETWKTF